MMEIWVNFGSNSVAADGLHGSSGETIPDNISTIGSSLRELEKHTLPI